VKLFLSLFEILEETIKDNCEFEEFTGLDKGFILNCSRASSEGKSSGSNDFRLIILPRIWKFADQAA
jgi:hypothetical protein